jgi:hypothetical protein
MPSGLILQMAVCVIDLSALSSFFTHRCESDCYEYGYVELLTRLQQLASLPKGCVNTNESYLYRFEDYSPVISASLGSLYYSRPLLSIHRVRER